MDLKVAFLIVCLCALAITITEAGIPVCCMRTRKLKEIPKDMLKKVYKIVPQKSTGACEIDALLLYMKNVKRPLCLHPNSTLQRRGQQMNLKKFVK
ncbi:hypothetical protein EXN66_Car011326 [Channa argus]|uniref:Chemokine interleukin-8-like domain-containing protein n=1 Tax=Channa argus TaxID=215402 RepID=A0A6G1PZ83_CHAAH|nr:hypothetical protein EXN66_Car011326 [Channa argus]